MLVFRRSRFATQMDIPQVVQGLFRSQALCTPNVHCPIANVAWLQCSYAPTFIWTKSSYSRNNTLPWLLNFFPWSIRLVGAVDDYWQASKEPSSSINLSWFWQQEDYLYRRFLKEMPKLKTCWKYAYRAIPSSVQYADFPKIWQLSFKFLF